MLIVGRGILGLAVAEFFSRCPEARELRVVGCSTRPAGSLAAAANLATKGQLYARDPHFALKLKSKKEYKAWLEALLVEVRTSDDVMAVPELDEIFQLGDGIDCFSKSEDADTQERRVRQPEAELKARGLPLNSVTRVGDSRLRYLEEAWVDGQALMALLESVCRARGVVFEEALIEGRRDLDARVGESEPVVLCPGAFVLELLDGVGLERPVPLRRPARMTMGSTFVCSSEGFSAMDGEVLREHAGTEDNFKVTASGSRTRAYLSSTTLRVECGRALEPNGMELMALDAAFLERARALGEVGEGVEPWERRSGARIGFGHSELVVDSVVAPVDWRGGCIVVCAGAHKSGFLFAPCVGELVGGRLGE